MQRAATLSGKAHHLYSLSLLTVLRMLSFVFLLSKLVISNRRPPREPVPRHTANDCIYILYVPMYSQYAQSTGKYYQLNMII